MDYPYYPTFDEIQRLRDREIAPPDKKQRRPLLPLYRGISWRIWRLLFGLLQDSSGPLQLSTGERRWWGTHCPLFVYIGIDPYLVSIYGETATL